MKYTDEQRVNKIRETTDKLLSFLKENDITQEKVLTQEPLRWAITTPLYNIGEHACFGPGNDRGEGSALVELNGRTGC